MSDTLKFNLVHFKLNPKRLQGLPSIALWVNVAHRRDVLSTEARLIIELGRVNMLGLFKSRPSGQVLCMERLVLLAALTHFELIHNRLNIHVKSGRHQAGEAVQVDVKAGEGKALVNLDFREGGNEAYNIVISLRGKKRNVDVKSSDLNLCVKRLECCHQRNNIGLSRVDAGNVTEGESAAAEDAWRQRPTAHAAIVVVFHVWMNRCDVNKYEVIVLQERGMCSFVNITAL